MPQSARRFVFQKVPPQSLAQGFPHPPKGTGAWTFRPGSVPGGGYQPPQGATSGQRVQHASWAEHWAAWAVSWRPPRHAHLAPAAVFLVHSLTRCTSTARGLILKNRLRFPFWADEWRSLVKVPPEAARVTRVPLPTPAWGQVCSVTPPVTYPPGQQPTAHIARDFPDEQFW